MTFIHLKALCGAAVIAAAGTTGALAGGQGATGGGGQDGVFTGVPVGGNACPANALAVQGATTCTCPANGSNSAVWGTGLYTADSDICTAARHSGAISTQGGPVYVTMSGGQGSYSGTSANGISTSDWASYNSSFSVTYVGGPVQPVGGAACTTLPAGATTHSCTCGPAGASGAVWGSDPYTSDSDLCAAARHSGVIGAGGGAVNAIGLPGLSNYRASSSFGVSTLSYGSYSSSVTFDWN